MRIIFVRHGEPNYEKDCLTDLGRVQAGLVAERLKAEGIEEIWASPLGRALETAEVTSKLLGLPVKKLDFMREVTWGSKDGTPLPADGHPWITVDNMARQGVNLTAPDWRESSFFCNNRILECIDEVESGIDGWLEELGYRREGSYYIHDNEEAKHRTVALFSHGGSSSAALAHILNLPFPQVCALFHIDYTGVTVVRLSRAKGPATHPCLELLNDARHIYT